MNLRKIIQKTIRHEDDRSRVAGDVNAVVSANVGEKSSVSHVSSRQTSRVVQRSGETDDKSREDLERQEGEPLPDREVMSLISPPDGTQPLPQDWLDDTPDKNPPLKGGEEL